jgi:hypothetical protein
MKTFPHLSPKIDSNQGLKSAIGVSKLVKFYTAFNSISVDRGSSFVPNVGKIAVEITLIIAMAALGNSGKNNSV